MGIIDVLRNGGGAEPQRQAHDQLACHILRLSSNTSLTLLLITA